MRSAIHDAGKPLRLSVLVALLALAGCLEHPRPKVAADGGVNAAIVPAANAAPTIGGIPATSVLAGSAYRFMPSASDVNGDALTYQIQNKPQWATFSVLTGELVGTPGSADVGSNANIAISVSDGKATASLNAFTIVVGTPNALSASVVLTWTPTIQNTDGSPLTDLAGYNVYYGKSPVDLSRRVQLPGPNNLQFEARNLDPGEWFFTVSSYNSAGVESAPSISVNTIIS
jgi:hypothetical protein